MIDYESDGKISEFQTLIDIVEKLRAPGGCPWDREQTHESLKRNLLEEAHEALEAIDGGDPSVISEELGDLLVQIAFHADIAREAGTFDIGDVVERINRKLIRRHPHVFADESVSDAREVERNWERIKAEERAASGTHKSPVDGIPASLPALAAAQLMQDRVARAGFEWDDISGVLDKVAEEIEEFRNARTPEEQVHELGDILFVLVNLSRWVDAHAEDVLRQANARFRSRYLGMEELAEERGLDFEALPLEGKEELWQEVKRRNGSDDRREYARRVMANPIRHYILAPHNDVKPEWIEDIISEPYYQETDPRDGRELYYGWIEEIGKWVKVVVEDDRLLTAYINRRLTRRFGDHSDQQAPDDQI